MKRVRLLSHRRTACQSAPTPPLLQILPLVLSAGLLAGCGNVQADAKELGQHLHETLSDTWDDVRSYSSDQAQEFRNALDERVETLQAEIERLKEAIAEDEDLPRQLEEARRALHELGEELHKEGKDAWRDVRKEGESAWGEVRDELAHACEEIADLLRKIWREIR